MPESNNLVLRPYQLDIVLLFIFNLDVNNQRQFGLYFTNVFVILLEYILILIVAYLNLPLGICTNNNTSIY